MCVCIYIYIYIFAFLLENSLPWNVVGSVQMLLVLSATVISFLKVTHRPAFHHALDAYHVQSKGVMEFPCTLVSG